MSRREPEPVPITQSDSGTRWQIVDEVACPKHPSIYASIYAEGWQSWSCATWYDTADRGLRPAGAIEHQMRFRPGTEVTGDAVHAEGLLMIASDDGQRRYSAPLGSDSVPSLRVRRVGDRLVVESDDIVDLAVTDHDRPAAAIEEWADQVASWRWATTAPNPAPRVWCTWYEYFEQITEADVVENLHAIERLDLEVDVIQIDDGWSRGWGEMLLPNEKFGELAPVVDEIISSGKRAGIWLAPFVVGAETTLAREHADWIVGPAGYNWGQQLVGLDLTHPEVREYLRAMLAPLIELGIDYFKLDFLYGGAVPGDRHLDIRPEAAYRIGLADVREAVGDDAFIVGCGAPLLPSIGLVDAMRVSPDTFHAGGEAGAHGLRGALPLTARAWQHGRWWTNDPDCLVARPTYALREEWAHLVSNFPGLASFSDAVDRLDRHGLAMVRASLARSSQGPYTDVMVDDGAHRSAAEAATRLAAGGTW